MFMRLEEGNALIAALHRSSGQLSIVIKFSSSSEEVLYLTEVCINWNVLSLESFMNLTDPNGYLCQSPFREKETKKQFWFQVRAEWAGDSNYISNFCAGLISAVVLHSGSAVGGCPLQQMRPFICVFLGKETAPRWFSDSICLTDRIDLTKVKPLWQMCHNCCDITEKLPKYFILTFTAVGAMLITTVQN